MRITAQPHGSHHLKHNYEKQTSTESTTRSKNINAEETTCGVEKSPCKPHCPQTLRHAERHLNTATNAWKPNNRPRRNYVARERRNLSDNKEICLTLAPRKLTRNKLNCPDTNDIAWNKGSWPGTKANEDWPGTLKVDWERKKLACWN